MNFDFPSKMFKQFIDCYGYEGEELQAFTLALLEHAYKMGKLDGVCISKKDTHQILVDHQILINKKRGVHEQHS